MLTCIYKLLQYQPTQKKRGDPVFLIQKYTIFILKLYNYLTNKFNLLQYVMNLITEEPDFPMLQRPAIRIRLNAMEENKLHLFYT